MSERVALYPGSFDPITLGHLDVLERATLIFDRVIISVLRNSSKQSLFSVDERLELIREATRDLDHKVDVDSFDGLTVDHAERVGATAIVRGLRVATDFENEFQMALMNRRLKPGVHTVFLMTSFANVFISSSIIKEVARYGGKVEDFVPAVSAAAMRRKFEVEV
jgi:pantetheine-phosphate adenylyltransferase